MDHHHAVADPLDVAQQMRGDQHVHAQLAAGPVDQVEHVLAALRVHAVGGLVQQQQPGIVDQGDRQLDPLEHAGGEAAERAVALLVEADLVADLGGALARGSRRQAAELAHEGDEVRGGHVTWQAGALREIPDAGADPERVGGHVVAQHRGAAPVRHDQAEEELEEGGLAGAVGADQAGAAALDGDVHRTQGLDRAVALAQAVNLDDRHGVPPPSLTRGAPTLSWFGRSASGVVHNPPDRHVHRSPGRVGWPSKPRREPGAWSSMRVAPTLPVAP